ncbi:hypothetical protein EW146_g6210 [Bondarzewia mesenterica]|uniref:DNA endonuclease activator Ctp1 C-terminal domain-containing protein n=1 Tax=Bondarzewia mesenterica TaxID=1095465 RepID=A0A4S4LPW7_9AGAM|nr:hypothetical protein EW146_g6210 [Bondarzewia mesenterica]
MFVYAYCIVFAQIANLRSTNRVLEHKYFEATQRGQQLAFELGFEDIKEAELVISSNPQLYNRATVEYNSSRIVLLERELDRQIELRKSDRNGNQELSYVVDRLRQENQELRTPLEIASPVQQYKQNLLPEINKQDGLHHQAHASAQTKPQTLFSTELETSQLRLLELQKRYDALLETKGRISEEFRGLLMKWKRFKSHMVFQETSEKTKELFSDPTHSGISHDRVVPQDLLEDTDKDTVKLLAAIESDLLSSTSLSRSASSTTQIRVNQLPSSHRKSPSTMPLPLSRNILNESRIVQTSPTELASSFPSPQPKRKYNEINPDDSSQTQEDSQQISVANSPSTLSHQTSKSPVCHSRDLLKVVDRGQYRGIESVGENVDSVQHAPSDVGDELKPPNSGQSVHTIRSKRRKTDSSASDSKKHPDNTINAQFEVNPEVNGGLDYQFDTVVRNRRERQQLHAEDCECCRDYYEAVGSMPPRLQTPLWRSPPSTPTTHGGHDRRQQVISNHKHEISRHRQQWQRAMTPPGYWDIGFPDTQQASDINQQAAEMHMRKQDMVEQEARKEGGKYRKRAV